VIRIVPLLLCIAVLAGCASSPSTLHYDIDSQAGQVTWPDAPEQPRYRYLGQLVGESNFIVRHENEHVIGRKMLRWLAGLAAGKRTPVVLQRPQTGVVDDHGRILVTDVSRQAVFVFDRPAGRLRIWEMAAKHERFKTPVGIALGPDGEVWVADADLKRVIRLDSSGKPLGSVGVGELERPTGLAIDRKRGRVFVSDTHAHDIKVFDFKGQRIATWGHRGTGRGEFNAPTFVTYEHDRLYVTDTFNSRVQIFDAQGRVVSIFGRRGLFIGDMPRPKGIAVDRDGNIYVVESYYDYLLVYNAHGQLLLPIGGTGQGVGEFYLPSGVWTDREQRIYVADMFNGRIVVLQYLDSREHASMKPTP